jgi:predicted small secreted protein
MKTTIREVKEEVVRCRLIDDEGSTPETRRELATARLLHDVIEEGTLMGDIMPVPEIPVIDLRPMKRMRRLLWWVIIINVLVLISIFLCSCQLVQGAGRDITWAGGAGQKFLEYRDK